MPSEMGDYNFTYKVNGSTQSTFTMTVDGVVLSNELINIENSISTANNVLKITSNSKNDLVNIFITSMNGQTVYSLPKYTEPISMVNFPAGVYILAFEIIGKRITKKITKE